MWEYHDVAGFNIIANSNFANIKVPEPFGDIATRAPIDSAAVVIK